MYDAVQMLDNFADKESLNNWHKACNPLLG